MRFLLVIQYINQHFSRLSGGHSTCIKLLGLLTPFNMSLEVPKKVLVILVHQKAAKLPALKVFVASKLENLLHRMPFLSVKMFEDWQFCSPFVHKDDCYFFGKLKTHINWCEKPKKFAACLTPARHSRKHAGLCTNYLIEKTQGVVFIRDHCTCS